jgi:hypothetical protein
MQRLLLAKLVNLLKRVVHRVVVSTTIRVNASMTVSCRAKGERAWKRQYIERPHP